MSWFCFRVYLFIQPPKPAELKFTSVLISTLGDSEAEAHAAVIASFRSAREYQRWLEASGFADEQVSLQFAILDMQFPEKVEEPQPPETYTEGERYHVCAFPSLCGTPKYANNLLKAYLLALRRLFFEQPAEVRVIDKKTDEHIMVF